MKIQYGVAMATPFHCVRTDKQCRRDHAPAVKAAAWTMCAPSLQFCNQFANAHAFPFKYPNHLQQARSTPSHLQQLNCHKMGVTAALWEIYESL
jgi:hypothetical protein